MLLSVYIENIALIKRLSLEPSGGFCAFTGETGAGKSIIIDSLGLLCGARSDKEIIRTGEDDATVEGIFSVSDKRILESLKALEIEPEEDLTITVTRKISRDGRSSAKINGRSIPLSRLKAAMSYLISIHGQQDTQAFADVAKQLSMLDSFAKNDDIFANYSEKYTKYKSIKSRLDELNSDQAEREYRLDMLKYRINELKSASITVGEKEGLLAERKRLLNSEKIVTRAGECYDLLYNRDGSASELVGGAFSAVSALESVIDEAGELANRLESVKYELIDIAETVKEFLEADGENPERRLDECESRIELIKKLENKYKADSDDFGELLENWEAELNINENSEELKAKLTKELEIANHEMLEAARDLTKTRADTALVLCERVTEELNELDMPSVTFKVEMREKDCEADGADEAEFLISANKGEIPKPMAKIASGGELSRIMLCLKCVFADSEAIGTLIFDEIDSGVSGKTSEKIGIRLKNASNGEKTQVICVTHSAILAAKADAHYKISKRELDGRTITEVDKLDRIGRRDELARIMGGLNITDAVLQAAEEMLK